MNNFIVTGATSEIAKRVINRLHDNGKNLILVSRGQQEKFKRNNDLLVIQISGLDLCDESSQSKLLDVVKKHYNDKYSILHFVGDFWVHKPLLHTPFSEIVSMMNSHYISLCNVTQALTQHQINCGGGRLLTFSCNSVTYNYPDMIAFTCAKSAVETFIKCYSNEYAEYNISALALALPTIRTDRVILEKPHGDHNNYISMDELSTIIVDQILELNNFVNGNIVKLFKYSKSFYNEGYFERNPRQIDIEKGSCT